MVELLNHMSTPIHKAYGHDQLWKNIIEDFFIYFVQYFMPAIAPLVNFAVPPEFLDKQLKSIFPDKGRNRYVDKLVKVALLDGTHRYLYIHIEVQGYPDKVFNWRMFQCYYRILEASEGNIDIETIAILTDDDPDFRPGHFQKAGIRTAASYEFDTFKLIDHEPEALLQGDNPFGVIMQTAWYHLTIKDVGDDQKLAAKLKLVDRLRALGLTREQTSRILRFIKDYTQFETVKNYSKFDVELSKDDKTNEAMGMFHLFREEGREMGREEGVLIGMEKGREEGREEGRERGREELLTKALKLGNLTVEEVASLFELEPAYVKQRKAELGL